MLCSDTNAEQPAVKIPIALDLARDIGNIIEGVKVLGGNAEVTLKVRNGEVEAFDTNIRQSRKRTNKKIA